MQTKSIYKLNFMICLFLSRAVISDLLFSKKSTHSLVRS
uniref:Uncharacterized protein n=1 Tax=Anguilla anguilla TaxID=7936 RepID=A0A0E9Q6Y3_ANGAN